MFLTDQQKAAIKKKIKLNIDIDKNGCLVWNKGTCGKNYSCIFFNRKSYRGNRLSFAAYNKFNLKSKNIICHTCDNRLCVNPKHLWEGTIDQNNKDCHRKKRAKVGDNHWWSKFTSKQVLQIRKRIKNGTSPYIIASEYGVYPSTIYRLKDRSTWKSV